MKRTTRENAMHTAIRSIIERVPQLRADPRPEALRNAAKHLVAKGLPGTKQVARAGEVQLAVAREEVLADMFHAEGARSVAPAAEAPKPPQQTALVSGGSVSGMLAAVVLAKSGQKVVLVEPRPQHTRDVRFQGRQGMVDVLQLIDPKLAHAYTQRASHFQHVTLVDVSDGDVKTRKVAMSRPTRPSEYDAPETGTELVDSDPYGGVIAREFESFVEKYVKETFPEQIQFVQGKLHPVVQADGNVLWQVEKPAPSKDAPAVYEDLLKGVKPSVVIVAEGANSSTRAALGIEQAPTTPPQWWTGGVIHRVDESVSRLGNASTHMLVDEKPVPGAPNAPPTQQGGMGISDGRGGLWTMTQMPPGWSADAHWSQEQINDYYFKRAALIWQTSEEELRAAGATGPIATPGSQPTPFPMQGKAAKEAARVLPDRTVVALLGDAVQTSTSQGGTGMNIAVSEVLPLMTLMENLQSGVSPKKAAASYQQQIFEHGDAWSADGVQFFYPRLPQSKQQMLIHDELRAIAAWRREGGPTPLERLRKILEQQHIATAPVGLPIQ
jgi:2-polyprenyl-6-methoxyphenol hydroxylase-like FAD-dependent oxidoreductase